MEDLVLLGSFAAIVAFGYYIVSKLDLFMGKTLGEDEMRKERPCFHVVTSSLAGFHRSTSRRAMQRIGRTGAGSDRVF